MKIAIFLQEKNFIPKQLSKLKSLGKVVFSKVSTEMSDVQLINHAHGADIVGFDPDNFGGFEKAKPRVTKVAKTLPYLKGVTLSTTSFGWVDLEYFKERNIPVSNIPGYSRESVAEHALAMLLGLAKQIFVTDRRTQKNKYKLVKGFELKGKTLGIIGLGNIGSRMAELGLAIGMRVIAYNRTPKSQPGVEMKNLEEVLKVSDALSLHTTHEDANEGMLDKNKIAQMKPGVIIVNTVDRNLIDETALAKALRSKHVTGYAYEAEDFKNTPLRDIETAVVFKGFGWYTTEALNNLYEIVVDNIKAFVDETPQNVVNK